MVTHTMDTTTQNRLVYNKLIAIEKDVKEIKHGINRNDTHISFITKLYFRLQKPIMYYLGYTTPNKEDHDDGVLIMDTDVHPLENVI